MLKIELSTHQETKSERPGLDERGRQPNVILVHTKLIPNAPWDLVLETLEKDFGRIVHFRVTRETAFVDFANADDGNRLVKQAGFVCDGGFLFDVHVFVFEEGCLKATGMLRGVATPKRKLSVLRCAIQSSEIRLTLGCQTMT